MALRYSTALRNFLVQHGSQKMAFQGGCLKVYTGTQPATADDAVAGTLLVTYTSAGAAHTREVLATGTVTLTGGASGSVDTVTVNSVNIIPQGAVAYNTSLTQTATDLADAINKGLSSPEYRASSSGAVVTITAIQGTGAGANGFVVTATLTTVTATYGNMAGGVTAVNGLKFGNAAGGVLVKDPTQTWSGTAGATGTAGWFRFEGSVTDPGSTDSAAVYIRQDGSCATSGAQMNMSSTSITSGAVQTLSSGSIFQPSQ